MSLEMQGLRARTALVLGYGVTGRAVARFLVARGVAVRISDRRPLPVDVDEWLCQHAQAFEGGGHSAQFLEGVDVVIPSPGVAAGEPILVEARRRGVPVASELDVAQSVTKTPVLAVTGTNGKSTTVSLIGSLLELAGLKAWVGGNLGTPFVSYADRAESANVAVVEASSFQLEQSSWFRPSVAVLLNLEPNHLERHGTFEAYQAAKLRVFARQKESDAAVLPRRLADTVDHGRGRLVVYDEPIPPLPRGSQALGAVWRLDLAAAICACRELVPGFDATTLDVEQLESALRLPHRQSLVGTAGGVRFVDDSKATSAAATLAALTSVPGPHVLLLGGRSKRGGYEALAAALAASPPRAILLYGEAREELAAALSKVAVPYRFAADLDEAFRAAVAAARPGDVVLLSPACSSFDAFRSYEERGQAFVAAARRLSGFSESAKDA
ncbi:MAG: UDP-N-acetylmuramoyl-L-alanine--D-glutamate ligase [Candidatus Bipolaricaulota bacterium]